MSMFFSASHGTMSRGRRTRAPIDNSTDDPDDAMDDGTETGLEALRGNLERRGAEYFFAPPFLHLLVLITTSQQEGGYM